MTLDWASGADEFQSTLSVRRATCASLAKPSPKSISIHALRKESDEQWRLSQSEAGISIHALRKESDHHTR